MDIQGWKYYNHAAIPTCAPHENADVAPIEDGSIWDLNGRPLLARWTSDFDCGYETNWWYVIKDNRFDISKLKAKRRYETNKGKKNFVVREIVPAEHGEDIYRVAVAAYETYPKSYRPNIEHESFVAGCKKWDFYKVYGAFSAEDDSLCGYACLRKQGSYIDFCVMKAIPAKERLGLNAAMVCRILEVHEEFLKTGGYICDGARSINHETDFQNYLEKYFGFRKAFCKLHITYNPKLKLIIKILYPIRKILLAVDKIGLIHQINSVLHMEEMVRENDGMLGINNNAVV